MLAAKPLQRPVTMATLAAQSTVQNESTLGQPQSQPPITQHPQPLHTSQPEQNPTVVATERTRLDPSLPMIQVQATTVEVPTVAVAVAGAVIDERVPFKAGSGAMSTADAMLPPQPVRTHHKGALFGIIKALPAELTTSPRLTKPQRVKLAVPPGDGYVFLNHDILIIDGHFTLETLEKIVAIMKESS
jgi:hypothetical protein